MSVRSGNRLNSWFTLALAWIVFAGPRATFGQTAALKLETGLSVAFTAGEAGKPGTTDLAVLPNLWLCVPEGTSPTPFLPPGAFTAVWNGFVSLDLRSEYTFHTELNGELKLEVNGAVVLETDGVTNTIVPLAGNPIRLNKGTNRLTATFRSPAKGDAFLRVSWAPRYGLPRPVPEIALSHHAGHSDLVQAAQVRHGRELFVEHHCVKCHTVPATAGAMPELAMDAPSLEGLGSRRNYTWLARWILEPQAVRLVAHMPRLLHGANAAKDAETIAAYLASLKESTVPTKSSGDAESGKVLFQKLLCSACHLAPDATEVDQKKLSLKLVGQKFVAGTLPAFLRQPDAHYTWIRMPNFKLSEIEAANLAAYLEANAEPVTDRAAPSDAAIIERGKKLVQSIGCLNCHSLKLENQFSTRALIDLTPGSWDRGCLAEKAYEVANAPRFGFSPEQVAALRAFGATDRASLARHVPAEFTQRQMRLLNCAECHGKFDGFPAFEVLGGRLQPEWAGKFIAGDVAYKPRPWIESRMPAFKPWAEGLGRGLATLHGFAPYTRPEPSLDQEAAVVGQKLISADGGFSCVSCHSVGKVAATQVFESNGINLAYTGERLLKPYYRRWLLNPLQVEATSKMPVYFDEEGRSPLADVYDGSASKQIDAIWQYIRLGDKMSPPTGTAPAP